MSVITHNGKVVVTGDKALSFNNLIELANNTTGETDTTLTDAVQRLVDGYGKGISSEYEETVLLENYLAGTEKWSVLVPSIDFANGDYLEIALTIPDQFTPKGNLLNVIQQDTAAWSDLGYKAYLPPDINSVGMDMYAGDSSKSNHVMVAYSIPIKGKQVCFHVSLNSMSYAVESEVMGCVGFETLSNDIKDWTSCYISTKEGSNRPNGVLYNSIKLFTKKQV